MPIFKTVIKNSMIKISTEIMHPHTKRGLRGWHARSVMGFLKSVFIFVTPFAPSTVPTTALKGKNKYAYFRWKGLSPLMTLMSLLEKNSDNERNFYLPLTIIWRWAPKNSQGCKGVKAMWTSTLTPASLSDFFSGEWRICVCSVSRSHDLIVQSYACTSR